MKNYCQIGTWENIIAKDICVKIWHQNCPPTSEAQNWVTKPARKMCFLFRMVFFFWMSIPFFDWPQIMVALYIFYYIVNTTMYSQYTYISYTLKNNPFFSFRSINTILSFEDIRFIKFSFICFSLHIENSLCYI